MKRVLIVVGEASADRYGARLVHKLKSAHSAEPLEFFGTGGSEMEAAGVDLLCHISRLASIGPREALGHFSTYLEVFHAILSKAVEEPPDLAVLLDFPEFNLRLAKKLKRMGVRVIYYISPQIWAWRRGRVKIIRDYVDKMLVILPFEVDFYKRWGIDVEFVGHPLLEEDFGGTLDRKKFLQNLNLDPSRKTIALLPGSRSREVEYILPTLLRASLEILRVTPCQFLISAAPSLDLGQIRKMANEILDGNPNSLYFKIVSTDTRVVLGNSDFAIVKSGTSTLEAALVGIPFIIVYKISSLSWFIGNILIRSPFKGLVNLIAGKEIVPEFMQGDATAESLSRVSVEILSDAQRAARLCSDLAIVRETLGRQPATETAARMVASYL